MRLTNAQVVDLYNVARLSFAIEPIDPKYRTKGELRALAEDVRGALAAKSDGDAKDHLFLAHWDEPALAQVMRQIAAFPVITRGQLVEAADLIVFLPVGARCCLVWGPVQ